MSQVGTIASVWRYPAKSMQGDVFDSLPVGVGGVLGDRGWATRDEARGGIRGAKKIPGLMRLHARYVEEPRDGAPPPDIEVVAPDGSRVRSDDPEVDARLTALLEHPVTLSRLRPASDLDHYRRGAPDDLDADAELRAIFGREPHEPLPTFEGLPLDVLAEYESPPGTYFDAFPIHLVTDRSLASLAASAPDSNFDVRRFRPNLVIAVDPAIEGDFPEQAWTGRTLRAGDVELEVTAACPRCVMVTRPVGELSEDHRVLRTIVVEADQNIGVYATVRSSGTFEVRAPVALV